jgi:hypothetical protein
MHLFERSVWPGLLAAVLLAGCARLPTRPTAVSPPAVGEVSEGLTVMPQSEELLSVMPRSEEAETPLKLVTKAGLAEEIARHKGKVVLVNFWSLF